MLKAEVTREGLMREFEKIVNLVLTKNEDYGDAWQRQGMAGVAVRLCDKLCRLETWAGKEDLLIVDERIQDTLADTIGYAVLGLLYLRAQQGAGDS